MTPAALRIVPGEASVLPVVTWTPADVAAFLKTSEELARRKVKALEAKGHVLRVPTAMAGRRVLIFAGRFLAAAGLSESEIRSVLQGNKI